MERGALAKATDSSANLPLARPGVSVIFAVHSGSATSAVQAFAAALGKQVRVALRDLGLSLRQIGVASGLKWIEPIARNRSGFRTRTQKPNPINNARLLGRLTPRRKVETLPTGVLDLKRMSFHYNFILVALSVAVAIQASFVGLSLAHLVPGAFAASRRRLLAGATVSLAIGIWGMHFIGMLAIQTPVRIDYAILPTLISFLICALVTGVAIYLASLRSTGMLILGSVIMGSGIASMHFVGMVALHANVHMDHAPLFVVASIAIAIGASGLSLALAFIPLRRPPFWLCAVAMGVAISGMHYMAMAGTTFHAMPAPEPASEAISGDYLAMIVSVVAFSISGAFMLTLVPGEPEETPISEGSKAIGEPSDATTSRKPSEPVVLDIADREAFLAPPIAPFAADIGAALPIEKNRTRCQIALSDIVSVHSNAHYTYIFDGHNDLFCPLTISEIAERLPKQTFYRTHRSYIVSLAHVVSVKKAANSGVAEIGSAVRRTVPISRNRISDLRACLMAFQAHAHTGEGRL